MAIEIRVPSLGESIADATVAKWLKQPGDRVGLDEPIVELETDKVNLEVPAPAAGTLAEIAADEGATLAVGAVLGTITETENIVAPHPTPLEATLPLPGEQLTESPMERDRADLRPGPVRAPEPTPPVGEERPTTLRRSGPAARKMMAESGLDAATITPTGPGPRITKADVIAAANRPRPRAGSDAPSPVISPPPPGPALSGSAREVRVRMTRLRQRIAERLKAAQNTAAMLTTINEIDMSRAIALRDEWRAAFEKKHGVRLGFMSFFVKGSIAALKEIPGVNAQIDGDEIVYKNHYDIGVAVGTEHGLVVPVLRDADMLSFAEIEKTISELGRKAREAKLTIEDLSGGTFTISNGGIYGSLLSTPILNPPQSGILGMHKIERRPVVVAGRDARDEKIEIRPMMYVALSYDHRLVDGREAVRFLVRIKELVEDPSRLLFDL